MRAKKWGALFLSLWLAVAGGAVAFSASGEEAAAGKGEPLAEETAVVQNDRLTFTYSSAEDRLTLTDKASGAVWESIPPQAEEDAVAQGSIRKEMQSALIVRYADKKNNSFVANSRTSSVSRSGVTVYRQGGRAAGGIRLFPPEGAVYHPGRLRAGGGAVHRRNLV